MKGRWESNINVWFPLMYSQKWNCYFQNRIKMFCIQVPTLIYLWEIYIFPGSIYLFCCREISGPIRGIYKLFTDTWMWKLGLRPAIPRKGIHKWDFPCSVKCQCKTYKYSEDWQKLFIKSPRLLQVCGNGSNGLLWSLPPTIYDLCGYILHRPLKSMIGVLS